MKENKILDNTLELIDETGTLKAYEYLKTHLIKEEWSSQVYNFLYCLAATSNKPKEAMSWLNEAIIKKGLWYRPEVFEDEDLNSIRDDEKFKEYVQISTSRYNKAKEDATTKFSWRLKSADNLIVVLHGNQQNNTISKAYWHPIRRPDYQIEYLQSKEIDSCGLYRWSDHGDGPDQLVEALKCVSASGYNRIVLVGFSAGCNTILRGILKKNLKVEKLILFSPWIPIVKENGNNILQVLKEKDIELAMIYGTADEDCLPLCTFFKNKARDMKVNLTIRSIEGMRHEYPEDLITIIEEVL